MKSKQKEVLDFIKNYIKENCLSPSYQDICDGLGIKSKARVHYIIKDLEYLGLIERTDGNYRSLKIPKKNDTKKLKQENQRLKELLKYCRHIFYLSGYEDAVDVINKEIGEK
jgi:repressor LexA